MPQAVTSRPQPPAVALGAVAETTAGVTVGSRWLLQDATPCTSPPGENTSMGPLCLEKGFWRQH